ncbi:hypothetical protein FACS1894132_06020 [Clostridia bacterium]|nr:hypothetical protein FACS1894132_06020 [Clostridia bacterium]
MQGKTDTILTTAEIDQAKAQIDTYFATCEVTTSEIKAIIDGLSSEDNFKGDAYDGFNNFFTTNVKPIISDKLKEFTDSLKTLLDNVHDGFIKQEDPALKTLNENPQ